MTFDDPAACLKCITEDSPQAMGAGRPSPLFESAWSHAEACLKGARGSHAWDHTLRVLGLCERIGRAEGADLEAFFKRFLEEYDGKR